MAHWLRICLPMQRTWVDPWFRKIPCCHGAPKPVPQLLSLCSWTREGTTMRNPGTPMKSSPHSLQLEKAYAFPDFLWDWLFFTHCDDFLKLKYIWFTKLYYFQVYNTVIQHFYKLYSIYSYYKYWLYSLCCTINLCTLLILYIVVCTSESSTPILALPTSLSPLVTMSLFSISVSLFLFCYSH